MPKDLTAIELAGELFAIHSHADLEASADPEQVVYREEDILTLLKKLGYPDPDWEGNAKESFNPNWISPPGDTIISCLESKGITPLGLAEKMNKDIGFTSRLLQGKELLTEEIAEKLEEILQVSKRFWLNREIQYRKRLAGKPLTP
jgi:plasmid maintenance system antidote protein VapI